MANGLPQLLNKAAIRLNPIALLVADAAYVRSLFNVPRWGIYRDGKPLLLPDTVVSFDYNQNFNVAQYPMEEGAFQSYNKIGTPYSSSVVMSKGGSLTDRQTFLESVEKLGESLVPFDIVTPERVYQSATINDFNYSRSQANGAGMITVQIQITEIRITARQKFLSTKEPASNDAVNGGQVQPAASALDKLRSSGGPR